MTAFIELSPESKKDHNPIVSGSTWLAIWHLSWPLVLNMAVIGLASFTDVWVAGKLGAESQAAFGVASQIWVFMMLLATVLYSATVALVSRFWGAQNFAMAIEAAQQSIIFAFLFGVTSITLGLIFSRPLLHTFGSTPAVQNLAWQYFQVNMFSQAPFYLVWVCNGIARARGNAFISLLTWMIIAAIAIVLDLSLCLGPLHLGIVGIAWSWLIASTFGLGVALLFLRLSEMGACLNIRHKFNLRTTLNWCKRLLRIGLPTSLQDLAFVSSNFALLYIFHLTAKATACQAAWTIGVRIHEMIAALPIYALAMTASTIIGQNLGANQPERAELAGWQIASVGVCVNIVVGGVMFFAAAPIAAMMSNDPTVIDFSKQFMQIVGISEPIFALSTTLFGAMQGAGYTRWPMFLNICGMLLCRLPVAWLLTINCALVPVGAWYAIAGSACLIGIMTTWRFKTGVWKHQKV